MSEGKARHRGSRGGYRKLYYNNLSPPDHPEIPTLKRWLSKYRYKYTPLAMFKYDLYIKKKVRDHADGIFNTYSKGGFIHAIIEVQEPVNEMVFFHELMHAYIGSIIRPWDFLQFCDFSDLDISFNTKRALHALYTFLEEWFVELFIMQEVDEMRDKRTRQVNFLGESLDDYIEGITPANSDIEEEVFSNLSTLFHSWRTGSYPALVRLSRHCILRLLAQRKWISEDSLSDPLDGTRQKLHDVFLKYTDLESLQEGNLYYREMYAEFVNTIVSAQTGKNDEPAVIVKEDSVTGTKLFFQPILEEAVAEFDKDTNFVEELTTPMIEILEGIARERKVGIASDGKLNKALCWKVVEAMLLDDNKRFLGHYLIHTFEEEFEKIAHKHNFTIVNADTALFWIEE